MKKGLYGKFLTYEKFVNQTFHSAVKKIDKKWFVASLKKKKKFVLALYDLKTSKEVQTKFSKKDLKNFFPNLKFSKNSAIFHEKNFFDPLLSEFSLFRGILGSYTG